MAKRFKSLLVTLLLGGMLIIGLIALMRTLPAQAGVAQIVSDWQVLMLDPYDGTFTNTYSIRREITSTGTADYWWGRVISAGAEFSGTLWCVQGGQGISLTAGVDPYTNGVTTTLTYGPFSLRHVVTAELSFRHWISVAAGDGLEWGVSTDGNSFAFYSVTPSAMGEWETTTVTSALTALAGERNVYLAFRFHSDGSGVDKGVFLDDVRVRVRYSTRVYLPAVMRDYFAGYEYRDDFENWSSGWVYGSVNIKNPDGSTSDKFSYGYKRDDDGSKVYYIRVSDNTDHVFLTGPQEARRNFEYEAYLRLATYESPPSWGDEYGILISPVPIDPANPSAQPVYTLQIRLYRGGGNPRYLVKKWQVYGLHNHPGDELVQQEEGTFITQQPKVWNIFRIERRDDTLDFFVRTQSTGWKHVYTLTDDSLPDVLYIGFYAAHTKDYSYAMEFQFDNVYLNCHQ